MRDLKSKSNGLLNDVNKLKEKVVEDPQETLQKKQDAKSRLEYTSNELNKNKSKLTDLNN